MAFNGKLKSYQNAVELILQCQPILDILIDKLKMTKTIKKDCNTVKYDDKTMENENLHEEQLTDDDKQNDDDEKLVMLLQQRIQFILKSLTKLFLMKNSKKEFDNLANIYKMCYSRSLKIGGQSGLDLVNETRLLIQEIGPKLCGVQEIH